MKTWYDGVTASRLPSGAQMVAGYVDGTYRWSTADWARFPNAVKLQIAVHATTVADILDVETGNDMTPSHWVSWVRLCRTAGRRPTVYMNGSTWPSVRSAFRSAGVAEPDYWVAQYDGNPAIPAGAVAKQYATNNDYDTSSALDSWPSGSPAPTPTSEDEDMHIDLKVGVAVAFTNPAAVRGGTYALCFASDFAQAAVRVATFDLAGTPTVHTYTAPVDKSALRVDIGSGVNKVSVELTSGSACGLDLIAV